MHDLAAELFPICRSITGHGVRETLDIIRRDLPGLVTYEVASGEQAFDWTVPDEWNAREAYVTCPEGRRILDFAETNLHLLGYSVPVDKSVSLEELQQHLYSEPEQPDVIPYVTSYYEPRWGFCIAHEERERLEEGTYRVKIDTTLEPGHLSYGELIVRGQTTDEVLISTYVCHPSMANNELSGPVVAAYLAQWVLSAPRRLTYRFVFVPETIGSIVYISRNLEHLREHVIAGYNLSCIGDDRKYSYVPTRAGDTVADRVAVHVLRHIDAAFERYSYLERASDERQYNSPGVDLPVAVLARSKFRTYPEYHTSKDDLRLVTPEGLFGGYNAARLCLLCLERNEAIRTTVLCEPQMGKRGLYSTLSRKGDHTARRTMMDVLAYADGRELLEIANVLDVPLWELLDIVDTLKSERLLASV
jgi:aminopeptidase-like protein